MSRISYRTKRILVIVIPLALALIIAGVVVGVFLARKNTPVEIKITSVSHKTEYYVGDTLDTSALAVGLYSETDFLRYLDSDEYTVDGFDNTEAGSLTLTVIYEDFTTTYQVTIKKLPAETPSYASLEIYKMPTKTQYKVGETLDVSGGILQLNYTNGTYDRVELLPLMTSGFSSETVGMVTVRVDYVGMVTYFNVEIIAS